MFSCSGDNQPNLKILNFEHECVRLFDLGKKKKKKSSTIAALFVAIIHWPVVLIMNTTFQLNMPIT